MTRRILENLAALTGWRRNLAAFAAGLACRLRAGALLSPALDGAGVLRPRALHRRRARRRAPPARAGFAIGWFFGFGYFLVSLYWVGFAFLVQAEEFAWMAPFAVAGLPAFLALFTGGAMALAARFEATGWRRIFAIAFFFMLAEYSRGHLLTGLPWNLPGQALAGTAAGAQSAAYWGVYGLSLVALVIAMAPVAFLGEKRGLLKGAALSIGATAFLFAAGAGAPFPDAQGRSCRYFRAHRAAEHSPAREDRRRSLAEELRAPLAMSSAPGPAAGRLLHPVAGECGARHRGSMRTGSTRLSEKLPKNRRPCHRRGPARDAGGRRDGLFQLDFGDLRDRERGAFLSAITTSIISRPFGEYLPL